MNCKPRIREAHEVDAVVGRSAVIRGNMRIERIVMSFPHPNPSVNRYDMSTAEFLIGDLILMISAPILSGAIENPEGLNDIRRVCLLCKMNDVIEIGVKVIAFNQNSSRLTVKRCIEPLVLPLVFAPM